MCNQIYNLEIVIFILSLNTVLWKWSGITMLYLYLNNKVQTYNKWNKVIINILNSLYSIFVEWIDE